VHYNLGKHWLKIVLLNGNFKKHKIVISSGLSQTSKFVASARLQCVSKVSRRNVHEIILKQDFDAWLFKIRDLSWNNNWYAFKFEIFIFKTII
jgi:hypothetical protein